MKTPTTANSIDALLSGKLAGHSYDIGKRRMESKDGNPAYDFEHLHVGLDGADKGVLIAHLAGDSRGRETPGFGRLTIEEASVIRAEIIMRWNAHAEMLAKLNELHAILDDPEDTNPRLIANELAKFIADIESRAS